MFNDNIMKAVIKAQILQEINKQKEELNKGTNYDNANTNYNK